MTQADDRRNRILDRLPGPDYERIAGQAELVTLPAFAVICDTGKVLEYAYFPVSSVLSALIVLENGAMVEAATIGNEGMVGVSLLLGLSLIHIYAGTALRYTRSRLPGVLVYQEPQASHSHALKRELAIKGFSRQEKESMIRAAGPTKQHLFQ